MHNISIKLVAMKDLAVDLWITMFLLLLELLILAVDLSKCFVILTDLRLHSIKAKPGAQMNMDSLVCFLSLLF